MTDHSCRIAFFDAKPYDRDSFNPINEREFHYDIRYFKGHLTPDSVPLTRGTDVACIFVNDTANREVIRSLKENGVNAIRTNKIEQPSPNLMDLILGHKIDLVIDTPEQGVEHAKDGFVIRRNAIETGVNVLTSLDTAAALVTSLENTDVKKLTLIDIATIDKR